MNESIDRVESIPAFLVEAVEAAYGTDDARRALEGMRDAAERPVTLRANTLKATADEVARALDRASIAYERCPWYEEAFVLDAVRERAVWDLDIYRDGKVYLQSLSSMLPPLALGPRPGADILDMCAAPGGKTSQIAALLGGAARLTACEMNGPRAEKLTYNLAKLDARNVQVMHCDARKLDTFFSFDQILLDAPCSTAPCAYSSPAESCSTPHARSFPPKTRSRSRPRWRGIATARSSPSRSRGTGRRSPAASRERSSSARPVSLRASSWRRCERTPSRGTGRAGPRRDGVLPGRPRNRRAGRRARAGAPVGPSRRRRCRRAPPPRRSHPGREAPALLFP